MSRYQHAEAQATRNEWKAKACCSETSCGVLAVQTDLCWQTCSEAPCKLYYYLTPGSFYKVVDPFHSWPDPDQDHVNQNLKNCIRIVQHKAVKFFIPLRFFQIVFYVKVATKIPYLIVHWKIIYRWVGRYLLYRVPLRTPVYCLCL